MSEPGGALLIAGTTSSAGKSTITAGLCRLLARRGVSVAPFKAQNMSRLSTSLPDGAEISTAQAVQAAAAEAEPEVAMNPVLLKPHSDTGSTVIVRGRAYGTTTAANYGGMTAQLAPVVADSLADLRSRFDMVICEGAGSPAEINLRDRDLANMGLARAAGLPVVIVGDVDRGGVFASLFGTLAVLDPADQRLVAGFVINKFRGDQTLLEPGVAWLENITGRRVFGVLPHLGEIGVEAEDSLDARDATVDTGTQNRELDRVADSLHAHLDIDALHRLVTRGAPLGLPTLTTRLEPRP